MDALPMLTDCPPGLHINAEPCIPHRCAETGADRADRELECLLVQAECRARRLGRAQFEEIARHAHPDLQRPCRRYV